MFQDADGIKYKGHWTKGALNGNGLIIYPNGRKKKVVFEKTAIKGNKNKKPFPFLEALSLILSALVILLFINNIRLKKRLQSFEQTKDNSL